MKKIMLLLFLFPTWAFGQNETNTIHTPDPKYFGKRHSITFSYAAPSIFSLSNSGIKFEENPILVEGKYGFIAVGHNHPNYSGIYTLAYNYKYLRKLEIGAASGYEQSSDTWSIYDNPDGPHDATLHSHYLYVTANVTYLYVTNKTVDFFSEIEVGGLYAWDNAHKLHRDIESMHAGGFVFQLWYVNLRIKCKSVYVLGSMGGGALGLLKFGIGMQF
ncbi:MAG: hypothetical protein LBT48_04165 [Prevotellaceae bacterium]|jgi:hypothetical protein|nr:hypothetical protein [Prevotellaceae bacterium]